MASSLDDLPHAAVLIGVDGRIVGVGTRWAEGDGPLARLKPGESIEAALSEAGRLDLTNLADQLRALHAPDAAGFDLEVGGDGPGAGPWLLLSARRTAEGHVLLEQIDIDRWRRRQADLEALAGFAVELGSAQPDEIASLLLRALLDRTGVDAAALVRREAPDRRLRITHAGGDWEPLRGLELRDEAPSLRVESTGQTVQAEPGLPTALAGAAPLDAIGLPITSHGELYGVLWVGGHETLREETRAIVEAMAAVASSALQRAAVLETLEGRVARRTAELAEANAQLQELDRLKTKFIRDVSHELRTPVANLVLYLSLLERGREDRRAAYLAELGNQVQRLQRLVSDVVDASRLEEGAVEPQMETLDLNEIVRQVAAEHRDTAMASEVRLVLRLSRRLPPVRGDRGLLGRAIGSVVRNAVAYTRAGEIRIASHTDGGQVVVSIHDTGTGIEAEDLKHVFAPFYRGRLVGQSGIAGAGLGLAIAREIVRLHQGSIHMESTLGTGTRVRLRFPPAQGLLGPLAGEPPQVS